jgi:hypothetical protein
MNEDTKDAIENYYKLKNAYDKRILKIKRDIVQNPILSKTNKIKALADLKVKCISCGNIGGTNFQQEKTKLFASCNVDQRVSKKCNLNIEIDRGEYETIFQRAKITSELVEEARSEIIQSKLDLLFGYITEQEAVANFNVQKEEFDYLDINFKRVIPFYKDVVHNDRNKKIISELKQVIINSKQKMTNLQKQYQESGDQGFIHGIIEEYIHELYPNVSRLRERKYSKNVMECEDGTEDCDTLFHLIQEPYTYSESEVEISESNVLKNTK